jgi:hypothetical protein
MTLWICYVNKICILNIIFIKTFIYQTIILEEEPIVINNNLMEKDFKKIGIKDNKTNKNSSIH